METWELAWLQCRPMPPRPQPLSRDLLLFAQATAEDWLFEARFRCIVEEWVPSDKVADVLGGLLWSGFSLRGQEQRSRVRPIPVLVSLLYHTAPLTDQHEVEAVMRALFRGAFSEWCHAYEQHGMALRVAP